MIHKLISVFRQDDAVNDRKRVYRQEFKDGNPFSVDTFVVEAWKHDSGHLGWTLRRPGTDLEEEHVFRKPDGKWVVAGHGWAVNGHVAEALEESYSQYVIQIALEA